MTTLPCLSSTSPCQDLTLLHQGLDLPMPIFHCLACLCFTSLALHGHGLYIHKLQFLLFFYLLPYKTDLDIRGPSTENHSRYLNSVSFSFCKFQNARTRWGKIRNWVNSHIWPCQQISSKTVIDTIKRVSLLGRKNWKIPSIHFKSKEKETTQKLLQKLKMVVRSFIERIWDHHHHHHHTVISIVMMTIFHKINKQISTPSILWEHEIIVCKTNMAIQRKEVYRLLKSAGRGTHSRQAALKLYPSSFPHPCRLKNTGLLSQSL